MRYFLTSNKGFSLRWRQALCFKAMQGNQLGGGKWGRGNIQGQGLPSSSPSPPTALPWQGGHKKSSVCSSSGLPGSSSGCGSCSGCHSSVPSARVLPQGPAFVTSSWTDLPTAVCLLTQTCSLPCIPTAHPDLRLEIPAKGIRGLA